MAALARISVGAFSLMALYTLVFDVSPLNSYMDYAMWMLMAVGIAAALLSVATEGR